MKRSPAKSDVLFCSIDTRQSSFFFITTTHTLDYTHTSLQMPSHKTPRYCLYRDFVDAYMKGHPEMTRCVSSTTTLPSPFSPSL